MALIDTIPPVRYGVNAFKGLLIALLPRGILWRHLGETFDAFWEAIAVEFSRVEQRKTDLLRERVPGLSVELLPEHEAEWLREDEYPVLATLADRQAYVQTKSTTKYDPSPNNAFYIGLAADLGVTITIGDLADDARTFPASPFEARGRIGARTWGTEASFVWTVTITAGTNDQVDAMKKQFSYLKQSHTEIRYNDAR